MSAAMDRRSLDFSKLTFSRVVSSKDALRNVQPISFSEEVLSGKSKVIVTSADQKERK